MTLVSPDQATGWSLPKGPRKERAVARQDHGLVAVARLGLHRVADHQMRSGLGGQRLQGVGVPHLGIKGQRTFVPHDQFRTLFGGLPGEIRQPAQPLIGPHPESRLDGGNADGKRVGQNVERNL